VNDTWDPGKGIELDVVEGHTETTTDHPARPTNLGYTGSEEFLRLQFEEYLLALLSAVKYKLYVDKRPNDSQALSSEACMQTLTSLLVSELRRLRQMVNLSTTSELNGLQRG